MFALVLFVCYLDGGCEDIVVDIYEPSSNVFIRWTINGFATAAVFR